MKALLELLGKVTGWGEMVSAAISHQEVREFTGPDETVRTGKHVFVCAVTLCGDHSKIIGQGSTDREAMLNCAHKVVEHHEQTERWHRERRETASKAIRIFFGGEQDA